jgi:hypothetical protein
VSCCVLLEALQYAREETGLGIQKCGFVLQVTTRIQEVHHSGGHGARADSIACGFQHSHTV